MSHRVVVGTMAATSYGVGNGGAAVVRGKVITAPIYFGPKNIKARVTRREGGIFMTPSEKVTAVCAEFTYKSLRVMEPALAQACHAAIQQNFGGDDTARYVVASVERIHNFLRSLEGAITEQQQLPKLLLPPRPRLERLGTGAQWTSEEERRRRARLAAIEKKRAELEAERRALAAIEAEIAAERAKFAAERAVIEAELSKVRPALDAANEGLAAIKEEHLWEVRSYQTPPPMVHKVLSSVLTVLGTHNADRWDVILGHMKRKDFIPSIRNFDPSTVEESRIAPLRRFIDDPTFTQENASRASKAAAPLRQWVVALTEYAEVYARLRPLLDELERHGEQDLRAKEAAAAEIRSRVRALERKIAEMEAAFRKVFDEAELMERDADAIAAIDGRNAIKLADWEDRCRELRRRHAEVCEAILAKPPEIDEEAERIAAVCQARCEELLLAVERSFRHLKKPTFGTPEAVADAASPQRARTPARVATTPSSTRRVRGGERTEERVAYARRPPSPRATSERLHRTPTRASESRLVSLGGESGAASRSSPAPSGQVSPVPHGVTITPRPRASSASPLQGTSATDRAPRATGHSPARRSSSAHSASGAVRHQPSPLARPTPGSPYRGCAVERYYLALALQQQRSRAGPSSSFGSSSTSPPPTAAGVGWMPQEEEDESRRPVRLYAL
jgi:hypothetical protein